MTPKELIKAALDRLVDEHDEDPRSPLIRGLSTLLDDPERIPGDAGINLVVTCRPGGQFSVSDQSGRPVRGVNSVAVFRDQTGREVLQINL